MLLWNVRRALQQLRITQNRVHRRANFMDDVGQEKTLGLIRRFGRFFGLFQIRDFGLELRVAAAELQDRSRRSFLRRRRTGRLQIGRYRSQMDCLTRG